MQQLANETGAADGTGAADAAGAAEATTGANGTVVAGAATGADAASRADAASAADATSGSHPASADDATDAAAKAAADAAASAGGQTTGTPDSTPPQKPAEPPAKTSDSMLPQQPAEQPAQPTDSKLPQGKRDAIVFVPGLTDQGLGPDQTVEGVARRIGNALDIRATTASAVFRTEVREQTYGPHDCYKARVATVYRRDGAKEEAILDLFGMDYTGTLTRRFEKRNALTKILFTLWQFLAGVGLLVRSRGTTRREKAQLLYVGVILLVLAAYLVMLVIAAVDIVSGALSTAAPDAQNEAVQLFVKARDTVAAWYAPWREPIRASIVVLTALGVVFPTNFNERLGSAATTYLCAFHYLRLGDRRNELVAQLEALIERTAEVDGVEYERTHVLAYSFGTLIAADALFRVGPQPPPVRFRRVSTLVTIGFPFDLVRTYWPSYFLRRTTLPPQTAGAFIPPKWLNIYSPLDILGSNCRDDGDDGPAEKGVQLVGPDTDPAKWPTRKPDDNAAYGAGHEFLESLRFRDYLMFIGFQAHGLYWNREDEPSTDCFSRVVEYLYEGRPALG